MINLSISNGVIPKPLFSNNLYNKPEFQAVRSSTKNISLRDLSTLPVLRFISLVSIALSFPNDPLFVLVKPQVPSLNLIVNISNLPLVMITDQTSPVKTLSVLIKTSRKAKMIVKICPFKNLQNDFENLNEFLKEFSWVYKQEYKVDELHNQEEK